MDYAHDSRTRGPLIHILLGAYNGEKYIREQIRSIQNQDYSRWRLFIRDDVSSDATPAIVHEMAQEDQRIRIIHDQLGNKGAAGNFAILLECARQDGAAYICLADQDDVWKTWKLGRQMDLMLQAESGRQQLPILVHSDLAVVDDRLRPIHASFMAFQRIHHEESCPLRVLLAQNYVTGCTVMINRALLDLALPVPASVLMHDWWLALCAGVGGKLVFLPDQAVLYRQHGMNEIGAKGFWIRLNPLRSDWKRIWQDGNRNFMRSLDQAHALKDRIAEMVKCSDEDASCLPDCYLDAWGKQGIFLRRFFCVIRSGVHRQDIFTNALFILRCAWLSWRVGKSGWGSLH